MKGVNFDNSQEWRWGFCTELVLRRKYLVTRASGLLSLQTKKPQAAVHAQKAMQNRGLVIRWDQNCGVGIHHGKNRCEKKSEYFSAVWGGLAMRQEIWFDQVGGEVGVANLHRWICLDLPTWSTLVLLKTPCASLEVILGSLQGSLNFYFVRPCFESSIRCPWSSSSNPSLSFVARSCAAQNNPVKWLSRGSIRI